MNPKLEAALQIAGESEVEPEFLIWLYLLSSQKRHEAPVEEILRKTRNRIDLPKLALWLRQIGSKHELARLARIVARVRGG